MQTSSRSNIILIGMPGSGKSTVGVILAKRSGRAFVDTDLLIQSSTGRPLQDIVDKDGYLELRRIEEKILLNITLWNHVVATGGSAVYSAAAMDHLKAGGVVVFLDVDTATLAARVGDFGTRGLAKRPDQTFEQLFQERLPLYRTYAEITIRCDGLRHEQVVAEIMDAVENLC